MENQQWKIDTNDKEKNVERAKKIRYGISSMLAFVGVLILLSQTIPLAQSFIKGKLLEGRANVVSPVPASFKREINGQLAYYDPGTSYFENLLIQAGSVASPGQVYDPITKQFKPIEINESYLLPMALSIPSLDIRNINVNSNVHSYDEDIYNEVLKNGLAHFKGTPLPGDGGNSFIYGHSAVPSYFSNNQNNPETIFTKLENIEIGDEVVVEKDGKELKYVVRSKKIVKPDDFSILDQQVSREQLTLMTCHPVGLPTNRLIVTATKE